MTKGKLTLVALGALLLAPFSGTGGGPPAHAQSVSASASLSVQAQSPPIPPDVEAAPVAVQGGGYCYAGPHPVDTRVAAGPAWDGTDTRHSHPYPPFDLRLFALRDGCYYFVGDPTDFGYRGRVYNYYGAHPVLDLYGGGWCFMVGGHAHWWGPWSDSFVVMGPWFYWHGPYDPFFWSYWPYYSFYYRSYYPRYYAGGRFPRGGRGYHVAPPIRHVPTPATTETWRGVPATPAAAMPGTAPAVRTSSGAGARGNAVAPEVAGARPGLTPVAPLRAVPAPTFRAGPGFSTPPSFPSAQAPAFRSPAPAPAFRSAPAPTFRSAPAPTPAFRGSPALPSGGPWRDRRR